MAFIEDIFFGEKTVGMLDKIRKQCPNLRLALFSASVLPLGVEVRYLYWSTGSYLSLRDSEKEIRESLEVIFGKGQAVPSYLIGCLDEYVRFPYKEPRLTHQKIILRVMWAILWYSGSLIIPLEFQYFFPAAKGKFQ